MEAVAMVEVKGGKLMDSLWALLLRLKETKRAYQKDDTQETFNAYADAAKDLIRRVQYHVGKGDLVTFKGRAFDKDHTIIDNESMLPYNTSWTYYTDREGYRQGFCMAAADSVWAW